MKQEENKNNKLNNTRNKVIQMINEEIKEKDVKKDIKDTKYVNGTISQTESKQPESQQPEQKQPEPKQPESQKPDNANVDNTHKCNKECTNCDKECTKECTNCDKECTNCDKELDYIKKLNREITEYNKKVAEHNNNAKALEELYNENYRKKKEEQIKQVLSEMKNIVDKINKTDSQNVSIVTMRGKIEAMDSEFSDLKIKLNNKVDNAKEFLDSDIAKIRREVFMLNKSVDSLKEDAGMNSVKYTAITFTGLCLATYVGILAFGGG